MRNCFVLLAAFVLVSKVVAAREVTNSNVTNFQACKGKKTVFTAETATEFRARGGFDRRDRVDALYDDPGSRTACFASSAHFTNEYAAQALVATDLLSRTKDIVLGKMAENRSGLEARGKCVSGTTIQTAGECKYFETSTAQLTQMRLKLALMAIGPRCLGVAANAADDAIRAQVGKCLRNIELKHKSPRTWVENNTVTDDLESLTPEESGILTEHLTLSMREFINTRKLGEQRTQLADYRPFWDWVNAQANAAESGYYAHLAQNPTLRFIKSSKPTAGNWREALKSTDESLKTSIVELKKRPIKEFGRFGWALEQAITDAPSNYWGDYCEVAGHILVEEKTLALGRTAIKTAAMLGLGLASGGLGSAAVAGGLGAVLAGTDWVAGSNEYVQRMRECMAENACRSEELQAAESIAALDYMAVGTFGIGASAALVSRLASRSPALAARLAGDPAARAEVARRVAQCR